MKSFAIKFIRVLLNIIYSLMKLKCQKDKVVFISRQGNSPSLDFRLLEAELRRRDIETRVLCKTLEQGFVNVLKYSMHMLRQMNEMATSKVVVLDTYCIAASLLNHRKDLKIIQMWHALGAMKKFGLSILDMPEGKNSDVAIPMRMHRGYTHIFTSGEICRPAFAEAFGYPEEALTVMSLPRVDALLDGRRDSKIRELIYSDYPQLNNGKKNILYAPTHRMGSDMNKPVEALVDAVDRAKFNLVIKSHPLTKLNISVNDGIVKDNKYESIDMLAVSDIFITDYSAMTYEAALKGRQIIFYAYDKAEYLKGRTFYLDYEKEMPGPICENADEVAFQLDNVDENNYERELKYFSDKYVEKQRNCTSEIADLIQNIM